MSGPCSKAHVAFPSRNKALEAGRRMERNHRITGRTTPHGGVYRCTYCGAWHPTSNTNH